MPVNTTPKQEIKNYTRTPNILFEDYPGLHPQEKWLYINLVYLCGSKGTRYLSLRFISNRTGISTGALSGARKNDPGMIRNLHTSGLIHAEIKRPNGKGQSQYHITITDIWQLNLEFFQQRKSSEDEQVEDESVQNVNTSVQEVNGSVQNVNTNEQERSQSEQERSHFGTISNTTSKTTESNKTIKQDSLIDTPLTEPSMSGKWDNEKVVQYAEHRNGRQYNAKMREAQIKAAKKLHTDDATLTLDLFKQAFDKRFDQWWIDNRKALHVTEMAGKDTSGAIRLYAMLDKIDADKHKPDLKIVGKQTKPEDFTSKTLNHERNNARIQNLIEEAQKVRAERAAKVQ